MGIINVDGLFNKYFPNLANEFLLKGCSLKDFQKSVVTNVLEGNNTLCIMPTGGGKSLIYWLSGLSLQGITIVISPLIALIDEQTEKIREQGYEVLTIHGEISANKQVNILKKFSNGEVNPDFIFVSPERISTDGFFEYCIRLRKDEIKLIAIDEVHCVSQWGFSFRPFYKRIPEFLDSVYKHSESVPITLGLTATLNSKEITDICNDFRIDKDNVIKDDALIRSEIALKVLKFENEKEKEDKFWELLNIHKNEKILVYLYRKYHQRGVENLTKDALERGFKATGFHGDMSSKDRQEIINRYKNNDIDVIFATNAFGMGIDIPDIKVVIHFMIPESVEQYYQEIGRGARDIPAANAYVLYTNKNIQVKKTHFIDRSFPNIEELKECYNKITSNKIGLKTLQYFEDETIQKCLPYFLDNDLLSIRCKGVSNLKMLSDIKLQELEDIFNATKTKGIITTIKKTGLDPQYITNLIYLAVLQEKVTLQKGFPKCLIVESKCKNISDEKAEQLKEYIEEKKQYKHKLLDYFVYLLDEDNSSIQLHQEIGKYLGVPKFKLGRIYSTLKGDKVRSKSEVIIANLLYENGIEYEYEKKLFYRSGKIVPDFTITLSNGREKYWEHLGMIGTEKYDKRWTQKLKIYQENFPDQLEVTYEGATISDSAKRLIEQLKRI
ncbi:ATP-dependent DNA helicase RecQ [Clostridium carboxidivorans P7]|uniref:DNA 3'-5' helicase n=1 Tax=Clostridium carboxidivorans P7 TaxID=536227 RepID=C6Q202_9CLOT|nr:RecQ family ATP-dependent DNA helicase [Clostridium carboxidivorans]AKN33774.1 ATP-dependent DNA helicase RecQ [Clostridium carboxidivorans P7]EET84476.1 ATP-dependent DNA helicase, RecQ family [Clostridium carboxidivorans P7]EFG86620.1 putative D-tyrosyl-tRNA(Tyr) deacylase [Clostridium carboxidivorans P7]